MAHTYQRQTEPASGDYQTNPPKSDTWKAIGHIAAELLAKCEENMNSGQSEIVETYHGMAIEIEIDWHLRHGGDE